MNSNKFQRNMDFSLDEYYSSEVNNSKNNKEHNMEITLDQYIVENNIKQKIFPCMRKKKNSNRSKNKKVPVDEMEQLSLSMNDNFGYVTGDDGSMDGDESQKSDSSNAPQRSSLHSRLGNNGSMEGFEIQESDTPRSYLQWRLGKNAGRVTKSYRKNDDFSGNGNASGRRNSGLAIKSATSVAPTLAKVLSDLSKALSSPAADDYNYGTMNFNAPSMVPIQPLVPFSRGHGSLVPVHAPQPQQFSFVPSMIQKTDEQPKYDMKLQKEISQLQCKPFAYTCDGTRKPGIVSFDGPGVDSVIKPTSTSLSLNCRFG